MFTSQILGATSEFIEQHTSKLFVECKETWTRSESGNCCKFVDEETTFNESQASCEAINATLAYSTGAVITEKDLLVIRTSLGKYTQFAKFTNYYLTSSLLAVAVYRQVNTQFVNKNT